MIDVNQPQGFTLPNFVLQVGTQVTQGCQVSADALKSNPSTNIGAEPEDPDFDAFTSITNFVPADKSLHKKY